MQTLPQLFIAGLSAKQSMFFIHNQTKRNPNRQNKAQKIAQKIFSAVWKHCCRFKTWVLQYSLIKTQCCCFFINNTVIVVNSITFNEQILTSSLNRHQHKYLVSIFLPCFLFCVVLINVLPMAVCAQRSGLVVSVGGWGASAAFICWRLEWGDYTDRSKPAELTAAIE